MRSTTSAIVDSLAKAQETRRQWVILTEPTRQVALAADHELRRRHPGHEPEQSSGDGDGTRRVFGDTIRPVDDGAGAVPGTLGEEPWDGISQRLERISQNARAAQAKLDELRSIRRPGEEADAADLGPAWTMFPSRDGAIVQPARSGILPASEVLREAEVRREAAIPEAENA